MAVVNGYCTVEQVRAELTDDGTKLPVALIDKAINAASRAVDQHCGRRFWQDASPQTRLYRTGGCWRVVVDDISTTDGLVVKTDPTGDGAWSRTWQLSDYQLEPLNADAAGGAYAWWEIVSLTGEFPVTYRRPTLQVTARFGWSAVPDQVVEATLLRAVALFKRRDAPFGVAGFGEFGAIRIARQDVDVADLLSPYVIAGIA